jgi:hypothetical protein
MVFSSLVSIGSTVDFLDGSPQSTGHGHGADDDLRKKKPFFHPLMESGRPVKQYRPLAFATCSEKKCRNTTTDGWCTPAERESATKAAITRQQLGASWLGATPKCVSTSPKKGCSGTRIPASNASAYTQTALAGGGEHARRLPARSGANSLVSTPCFLHRASRAFWLRMDEAMRSVAGHEGALPPPPRSSSLLSLVSTAVVASGARAGMGSMIWTEDEEEGAVVEEEGMAVVGRVRGRRAAGCFAFWYEGITIKYGG